MSTSLPSGARPESLSAVRVVRAIRQRLFMVLSIVLVAVVGAAGLVMVSPKKYEATADVAVNPLGAGDETFQGFNLFRQPLDASSTVVTAARALGSPLIRSAARKAMGADAAGTTVAVSPLSQADVVVVTATSPAADQAARAANAYAR